MAEAARPALRLSDARAVTRIAKGAVAEGRASLFSLFRDEMFFAPAFFDHYRGLGIEQFVILDDGSSDGTRAFLLDQPDCVLLVSDLAYGDRIVVVGSDGRRTDQRAGVYFKMAVPPAYLPGGYVTYVDADEFLFLPPAAPRIPDVVARLRARGDACCAASIVEFFPETAAGLRDGRAPGALADLLAQYGCFQPEPMVEIDPDGVPHAVGRSTSARLFARHGVRVRQRGLRRRLRGLFVAEHRKSPQFKTPIFRCDDATCLTGTHTCSAPAPRDRLLTIGHFVFTAQFEAKVGRALAWRSYVNGSDKYEHYARLLRRLDAGDGALADAGTARFDSVEQFLQAGLMRW